MVATRHAGTSLDILCHFSCVIIICFMGHKYSLYDVFMFQHLRNWNLHAISKFYLTFFPKFWSHCNVWQFGVLVFKIKMKKCGSKNFDNRLRHGKSRKHASKACKQFLEKLWAFLDWQNFFAVSPGNAHKLILLSTLYLLFVRKYPMCWGKLQFGPLLYALELFEFADISQHWKLACGQKLTFSMSEQTI